MQCWNKSYALKCIPTEMSSGEWFTLVFCGQLAVSTSMGPAFSKIKTKTHPNIITINMQPCKLTKMYNKMLSFVFSCKLSHPLDGNVCISATRCKSQWGCLPSKKLYFSLYSQSFFRNKCNNSGHQNYNTAVFGFLFLWKSTNQRPRYSVTYEFSHLLSYKSLLR